jgi:ribose-phosphate pyrophosphokinase
MERPSRSPLHLVSCVGGGALAAGVAKLLDVPLVATEEVWFACGEGKFVINENVRGGDVYIFQSPIGEGPRSVYDRFVMLLHAVEAAALSDAEHVTAVVPYFPGARQDKRKGRAREGISAGLFARCLQEAGADRVVTVDIHNDAIAGMFDPHRCRLENVRLTHRLSSWLGRNGLCGEVVASPDVGGMERARQFGQKLGSPIVAISKERDYSTVNAVLRSTLIGKVRGKDVLLVDDIIDTAGSVTSAVDELKAQGAVDIMVACAHAVFSDPARTRLQAVADRASAEGWRFRVIGGGTIRHAEPPDWFEEFPVERLMADVIRSLNRRGSVTGAETSE